MPALPRWTLRRPAPDHVARVARSQDLPEVVARLLVSRGHTEPELIRRFLAPSAGDLHDPALLPGMEAATERLARAVKDKETILVHGDYDVDGVTGTALLMRLFELVGGNALWHIPNRLVDGYSFGAHSVERAEATGAKVVISVDNGTSARTTITELAERGIDTVVTDHHEPPPGELPPAVAIVNPKVPARGDSGGPGGAAYPWRELCGGAVAFKLAWGLAREVCGGGRVSPELKRFLEEAMAYVAIATVCDVVPLLDENRVLASYGLRSLEGTRNPGLAALVEVSGLAGRPLSAEDVAFQIGPRINASGRLGSAATAVEVLLAPDERTARAKAAELDRLNVERREIEAGVLAQAEEEVRAHPGAPMLVLAGEGWHQGVVGIVAARLTETYGKPALVIGLDGGFGRGSARSVPGVDVLSILHAGAEHMQRYGGHEQAAGCEVDAAAIPALREALCERAAETLAGVDAEPTLSIDAELALREITPQLMRQLDRLEPFGAHNEGPILLSTAHLAGPARAIGQEGRHLMIEVRDGAHALRGVAFGLGDRLAEARMGVPLQVVHTPRWNTFRGETRLELRVHDFRAE